MAFASTRQLRILSIFAAALSLFSSAANGAEKGADADVVILKIYDVRDLTEDVADFPGPDLSLGGVSAAAPAPNQPHVVKAQVVTTSTPTAASIADMIKTRIRPDTWDAALGTSVEEMAGRLVVMQKPEIHALIQQLLKSLSNDAKPQLVVRAMLIPAITSPEGTFFDAESLTKALGGNPAADAVAVPQIVCFNKQRVDIFSGTDHNYVSGVDVNGDSYDPVVQQILTGFVLDVRPVLSGDRKFVDMDLRLSLNSGLKMNSRFMGASGHPALQAVGSLPQPETGSRTTKKTEPGKDDDTPANSAKNVNQVMNSQYTAGIEMDFPTVESGAIRTNAAAPLGKWVLAGSMNNPDEKSPKKQLLCFVMADLVK